jgi:hypothetical protein
LFGRRSRACFDKLKKASQDIIDKKAPYEFGSDAWSYLRKNGYSPGLTEIFATDNYLHFTYMYKEESYDIFWNLAANKGYYTPYEYRGNIFEHTSISDAMITSTTTDDAFVNIIQVSRAIEDQQGEHTLKDPRVLKVMENIQEEDNPIVAFYYIKK